MGYKMKRGSQKPWINAEEYGNLVIVFSALKPEQMAFCQVLALVSTIIYFLIRVNHFLVTVQLRTGMKLNV